MQTFSVVIKMVLPSFYVRDDILLHGTEEQTLKCVRNAERNILIQSRMNNTETEETLEERQDGSDLQWETRNVWTVS
jgi:hypothetical protein